MAKIIILFLLSFYTPLLEQEEEYEVQLQLVEKLNEHKVELGLIVTSTNHFNTDIAINKFPYSAAHVRVYRKNDQGTFQEVHRPNRPKPGKMGIDDSGQIMYLPGVPVIDNYNEKSSIYEDYLEEITESNERTTQQAQVLLSLKKEEQDKVLAMIEGEKETMFDFLPKKSSYVNFLNLNWLLEQKGEYMICFEMPTYTVKKDDIRIRGYLLKDSNAVTSNVIYFTVY